LAATGTKASFSVLARTLAYFSIAQIGYLLLGLEMANTAGLT